MADCEADCRHQAYDPACTDYPRQICCGYIVNIDDHGRSSPELHVDRCHLYNPDLTADVLAEAEIRIPGSVWLWLTQVYGLSDNPDDIADRHAFQMAERKAAWVKRGFGHQVIAEASRLTWYRIGSYLADLTELYEVMSAEERGSFDTRTFRKTVDLVSETIDWRIW